VDTALGQQRLLQEFLTEGGVGYGQQWCTPEAPHLSPVREFLRAAAQRETRQTWLEIGCGGGRWTRIILQEPHLNLELIDGCAEAELLTRQHCGALADRIESFRVCAGGQFPSAAPRYDVVFSFDTFVHFPPDLFHNYLCSIAASLKPNGLLYLHHGVRYPENPLWMDGSGCFVYYSPAAIQAWCAGLGLHATTDLPGAQVAFPAGFGSYAQCYRKACT